MARMRPQLSDEVLDALPSQAEAKVYRACRDLLDERILVIHSQRLVSERGAQGSVDGEADFVIFDPQGGVTVLEVKGGGIQHDPHTGTWYSRDRHGRTHTVKNPFMQAKSAKFEILKQLERHGHWRSVGRIPLAHAAIFPDLRNTRELVTPESPEALVGGELELQQLPEWLEDVASFWGGHNGNTLGINGMRVVEDTFLRPIEVEPLLATQLRAEETIRIKLTEQQSRVFRALGRRKKAAIFGGAGTGKTILALGKAQELASAGLETLLLCYNRPLADHIRRSAENTTNLSIMNFHQLCHQLITQHDKLYGMNLMLKAETAYPGEDRFAVHMPYAMMLSLDNLEQRFDAILVDEAQDFLKDYWLPVEMLLRDDAQSIFYIFFDQNQSIYTRQPTLPIKDAPFILPTNCRNTRHIHEAAYAYYEGEETDPPELEGAPIEMLTANGLENQAQKIQTLITKLMAEENVNADDITVLIAGTNKRDHYLTLQERILPGGTPWHIENHAPGGILVDTVRRFKGLEAAVLIIWGLEDPNIAEQRETLYVALSRAKSRLYLVGTETACRQVLQQRA